MRYFSMFSGIGAFELAIQQVYGNKNSGEFKNKEPEKGFFPDQTDSQQRGVIFNSDRGNGEGGWECPTCVGFSEIDKYAIQTYRKHFPEHKNYGDATKIITSELPEFDLLLAGFPCQSFSIAGKRGGFEDTRGTLFFEIARIAKDKRPSYLLLENVKGLLSHDKGNTFATIISTIDELGYDCQWNVLNSKDFGVPQNRERVFIVGHLRGIPRPKVFPF
jgi:DNA (cytosine-5)-methyltransferase 1